MSTEKQMAVLAAVREIQKKAEDMFSSDSHLLSSEDLQAARKEFNEYLTKKIFALLDKVIAYRLV